jgi:endonuclease/exonuclease/phosphatase (EEP) superfamily protein YafD
MTLSVLILSLSISMLSVTILSYYATTCRLLDTFCHFKVQVLIAVTLLGVGTVFSKKLRKTNLTIISLVMVLNLIDIIPWYLSPKKHHRTEIKRLRVCMINVLKRNDDFEDVRAFIHENSPDILVLMETDERWLDELKRIDEGYVEKVVSSELGNSGIVLYSRFPIANHREIRLSPKGRPNFHTVLNIDGRMINIFVSHPVSPTRKKGKWEDRNIHIENLAKEIVKVVGPTIVIADLNTTMWSPFYKELVDITGLVNSREGFGINGSYPAPYASVSGLPIDHILLSQHFSSQAFKCGPHIGSDHLPVWADIVLLEEGVDDRQPAPTQP